MLTLDHWAWNICGGDGDGPATFAFFEQKCPKQVDVPDGYFFQAGTKRKRRNCKASAGTTALIPIINVLRTIDEGETEEEGLAFLSGCLDLATATKAKVNGQDVPVLRLAASTDSFDLPCPVEAAGFDFPLEPFWFASDGYWVAVDLDEYNNKVNNHVVIDLAGCFDDDSDCPFGCLDFIIDLKIQK
jgi:NAD-dependent dihydropyrimidine dehydrogenase PreA subunit